MTIAPLSPKFDYHHPRSSSDQFSRDLDFLHRMSARMPQANANRDINNNELMGDQMEICCNAGFKPSKLNMTLNGNQLSIFGQQSDSNNRQVHCFGETFILPENIDPNNIYCEVKQNNQLSINMQQMNFEANGSSMLPFGEAKNAGLW